MDRLRSLAGIVVIGWFAACGGKVFVDLPGAGAGGGGGATGGAGGVGPGPSVGGGPGCVGPDDPTSLFFCGGSATAGSGMEPQCVNDFCDGDGNIWEASCGLTHCTCLLNKVEICSCELSGPWNFCGGTPTCCPLPKI